MLASPDAWARLSIYADLLLEWNARINLIGRGETDGLLRRHLQDSLAVVPLLPAGAGSIVDLGSGAGLPGLAVAIATGLETHLVERDQRKCAFLREASRRTNTPVGIHCADFGDLSPLAADVVLSRATASLTALLDAGRRHARKGGVMVLHKSSAQEPEMTAARTAWMFTAQVFLNPVDPRGRLWRIAGIERIKGSAV